MGDEPDHIDRFDVRAHLDQIPEKDKNIDKTFDKDELSELMYERYREIIHNDFRGLDQRQVLTEIHNEESFENQKNKLKTKPTKPSAETQKAAINFTYEDGDGVVKPDEGDGDPAEGEDDSDEDGPGIALIKEVMNPSLLSASDKSIIDNK